MANPKEEVTIHIDKTKVTSPNPTTGSALYALGGIKLGFALFKEVHGQGDDAPIANDSNQIDLKNGDHFYSSKDELNPGQ